MLTLDVGVLSEHSRRPKPSAARDRNRCCLVDDQATFRSALRVICEHELSGGLASFSASSLPANEPAAVETHGIDT
jgi:hypothetical protein